MSSSGDDLGVYGVCQHKPGFTCGQGWIVERYCSGTALQSNRFELVLRKQAG